MKHHNAPRTQRKTIRPAAMTLRQTLLQAVNNGTAEDREININITDKINSFGGEKQVSPAPSERRFEF